MTLNQLLILMYCRVKYDAVIVNNVLDGSAWRTTDDVLQYACNIAGFAWRHWENPPKRWSCSQNRTHNLNNTNQKW